MKGLPFLREEGDKAVVTASSLEFILPESYFQDPAISEDLGGSVSTLCFLGFRSREKEGSKPRLWTTTLPARLTLRYSSKSTEEDAEGDTSRVFRLVEGEVLIDDLRIIKSAENVTEVFRALMSARLDGVAYEDLIAVFTGSSDLNGTRLGVSRPVLESMVSEMARWEKDRTVPFRIPLTSGKAGDDDFIVVKLKELPRTNSVFTGLSFEDITLAVQSGVKKTMNGERQNISPAERIIKY